MVLCGWRSITLLGHRTNSVVITKGLPSLPPSSYDKGKLLAMLSRYDRICTAPFWCCSVGLSDTAHIYAPRSEIRPHVLRADKQCRLCQGWGTQARHLGGRQPPTHRSAHVKPNCQCPALVCMITEERSSQGWMQLLCSSLPPDCGS